MARIISVSTKWMLIYHNIRYLWSNNWWKNDWIVLKYFTWSIQKNPKTNKHKTKHPNPNYPFARISELTRSINVSWRTWFLIVVKLKEFELFIFQYKNVNLHTKTIFWQCVRFQRKFLYTFYTKPCIL